MTTTKRPLLQRVLRFFTHKAEDDCFTFAGGECSSLLLPNASRLIEEQYALMQAEKAHALVDSAMWTLEGFGAAQESDGLAVHSTEPGYLLRTLQNQHSPVSLMKAFAFVRHQLELGIRTYGIDKKRRSALESLSMEVKALADTADAILALMEQKVIYADQTAIPGARHGELLHRIGSGQVRRLQPDQLNKLGYDMLHAVANAMRLENKEDILRAEQRYEHSARWLVGLVQKENVNAGPMLMAMDSSKAAALAERSYAILPEQSRYKH